MTHDTTEYHNVYTGAVWGRMFISWGHIENMIRMLDRHPDIQFNMLTELSKDETKDGDS